MKIAKYILVGLIVVGAQTGKAQNARFISQGKIEFEHKLNLHSQYTDDDFWSEMMKKNLPQFKTTYFDLVFSDNKTLYQPGKDIPENNKLRTQPAEENVVYSDLDKNMAVSQKKVFEKTFLVQDSTRKIQWKITDEKRTIAGFECRRANAIIMDSLYVVAFYTDEIITPGGPESFSGLPGMILGVAIPHEHITWFATKLTLAPVKETDLKAPAKGTKVTNTSLKESLRESLKNWGTYADRYIKAALL